MKVCSFPDTRLFHRRKMYRLSSTAGLRVAKPGLKLGSPINKEKQIPVSHWPAKFYNKKDVFDIHGAATAKTANMISSIFIETSLITYLKIIEDFIWGYYLILLSRNGLNSLCHRRNTDCVLNFSFQGHLMSCGSFHMLFNFLDKKNKSLSLLR